MEQTSQVDQQTQLEHLEGQLRECYGRVVYSHKTHEKCADILLTTLRRVKNWQIVLSAVTTGGLLTVIFGEGQAGAIVSVIASTALLALNTYTKSYDLGEVAQKHKQAASDIWHTREQYLSLITDLRVGNMNVVEIVARRDELLDSLHRVYSGAPTTTHKAYKEAQTALQVSEDMTFTDDEIDTFLPDSLKKSRE